MVLGIGGLVDMKPICGIIVVRRKVRAGKEGKVSPRKMKFIVAFDSMYAAPYLRNI